MRNDRKQPLLVSFSKTAPTVEVYYALKRTVRHAIAAALAYEGVEQHPTEVSVTFTDNAYIQKLNLSFRGVDKPTDVLSFPMLEEQELKDLSAGAPLLLGDIVISLERAKKQAEEIGNSFMREVAFLTVHSVLHLLGYDHERSDEEDALQCQKQAEILEILSQTDPTIR